MHLTFNQDIRRAPVGGDGKKPVGRGEEVDRLINDGKGAQEHPAPVVMLPDNPGPIGRPIGEAGKGELHFHGAGGKALGD